ncbi:hypothetical protein [Pseudomonas sp. CMR5c]|uniref:hypothetical protein n=1 Tax=Pseudomonas sp. CMR5c TaxID=658630 RepID=UPI000B1E32B7|nr:hypothetical protein [Pseudomonas sp. CMR5c]AZC18465.1 hypothetical protein C4K40_3077 [Pseudomonas sp. CMR5c]
MSYRSLLLCTLFTLPAYVLDAHALSNDDHDQEAIKLFNTSAKAPCISGFPCFAISNQYPTSPPAPATDFPWSHTDYKTDPAKYMAQVLAYVVEGNTGVDWELQKNPIRRWYHAPWMHAKREPVHGLTMERGSRLHELGPDQTRRTNNWAVGFYNDIGGSSFGKVWQDKARPTTTQVVFPVGTVTAKLLFTDATDSEAPYLKGNNLQWQADITNKRKPQNLRLLQMDIAVKGQADATHSGWVFGTFVFNGARGAANYWDNLIPVGLEWGNSTKFTYADYQAGKRPGESWVNPEAKAMFANRAPDDQMGYLGRMNGPVDSPLSSCMSCHSRAMDTNGGPGPDFNPKTDDNCLKVVELDNQQTYERLPTCKVNEQAVRLFYRNLKSDEPFIPGFNSLDYSLQMALGVANWHAWNKTKHPTALKVDSSTFKLKSSSVGTPVSSKIPLLPAEEAFQRGD